MGINALLLKAEGMSTTVNEGSTVKQGKNLHDEIAYEVIL